jgi:hypothetical protein
MQELRREMILDHLHLATSAGAQFKRYLERHLKIYFEDPAAGTASSQMA